MPPTTFADYRNLHRGKTILVCGCGNSLNGLTTPERFITIGVNDIGRLFQPDYLVIVDPKSRFTPERFHHIAGSRAKILFTQLEDPEIPHKRIVRFRLGEKDGTDFTNPDTLNYSVISPYVALCLALHLGAARIGVIGVDFTDNHFFADTGSHAWAPQLAMIDDRLARLNTALAASGIRTFNLSAESRITAFPKLPLDVFAALPRAKSHPPLRLISYATAAFAAASTTLVRNINAHTPHIARGLSSTHEPGDLDWTTHPARAAAEIEAADAILLHNGHIDPRHTHLMAGRPVIILAQSPIGANSAPPKDPTIFIGTPDSGNDATQPLRQFARLWQRQWQPAIDRAIVLAARSTRTPNALPAQPKPLPPPTQVALSVIIAALNEGDHLRHTVTRLRATLQPTDEIIVIDDGSTDASSRFLTHPNAPARLIRAPTRLGMAAARNLGAQHAAGRLLVFADAHVAVPDAWSAPLAAALDNPDTGAVMPAIHALKSIEDYTQPTSGPGRPPSGYGLRWTDAGLSIHWLPRKHAEPYPVPLLHAAFLAIRRNLFTAIGGFDRNIQHWGTADAELSLRLWTAGFTCLVEPTVNVAHLFRTTRPYPAVWDTVTHNKLRLATLHFSEPRRARVAAHLALTHPIAAAQSTLDWSDAATRRTQLHALRRYDDTWFFHRFKDDLPPDLVG